MRGHLLGTFLCLLSACGVLDPERREIGVLDDLAAEPPVEVPSEVFAGQQFEVTIRTAWRDGCARRGEVEARWTGARSVTLTPFVYVDDGGMCTQSPVTFTHTEMIQFGDAGSATVIVRGRSGFEGEIVLMERAVQVDRAAVMGLTTRVGPQWTPDPLE